MGELKKIKVLSDWLEYELETKLLNPPTIKLKLSPIHGIQGADYVDESGKLMFGEMVVELVLKAVKEWDLSVDGKPLLVTEENKRGGLLHLLGAPIKGKKVEGKSVFLGVELFNYASNLDNFLKN